MEDRVGTGHHLETRATGPVLADADAGFLAEVPNPNTARELTPVG